MVKSKKYILVQTALVGKIPPLLVLDHWPNDQMTMVPRRQVTTGHTVVASSIIMSVAWKTGLVKRTTKMINWLGPHFKRSEIVWFICIPPYWRLPHPHVFPTWIILFQNCQSPKHLQVSVWEFKSPLYNSWSPSPFSQMSTHDGENTLMEMYPLREKFENPILEIFLFSQTCQHRITYCFQNESSENH